MSLIPEISDKNSLTFSMILTFFGCTFIGATFNITSEPDRQELHLLGNILNSMCDIEFVIEL